MNSAFIVSPDTQEKLLPVVLLYTTATLVRSFSILTTITLMFYVFNNIFLDAVSKGRSVVENILFNYIPVSKSL